METRIGTLCVDGNFLEVHILENVMLGGNQLAILLQEPRPDGFSRDNINWIVAKSADCMERLKRSATGG